MTEKRVLIAFRGAIVGSSFVESSNHLILLSTSVACNRFYGAPLSALHQPVIGKSSTNRINSKPSQPLGRVARVLIYPHHIYPHNLTVSLHPSCLPILPLQSLLSISSKPFPPGRHYDARSIYAECHFLNKFAQTLDIVFAELLFRTDLS